MHNKDSVFIIAEAGVNHNGDIELAYKLIDKAVEAKVDAVKFQTFVAEKLVSKFADKAEYQKENTNSVESQLEMIKKLELKFSDFKKLNDYCNKKGIFFLSTAFDSESIEFLDELNMPIFKIPSGEITNLPYLIEIARTKKKIIISTGMCTLDEVEFAINTLKEYGASDVSVLHCNTEYPTPMKDVNLNAMLTLKEKFQVEVGYSDHTLGTEIPVAAVTLGAKIIEKHFTLDNSMEGPDHKASLNPEELKLMVYQIRNIEMALGSKDKQPSESEFKNINIARKSIVAKQPIKCGDVLTEDNLAVKRPGDGISPVKWFEVIGQRAIKDFMEDEQIVL